MSSPTNNTATLKKDKINAILDKYKMRTVKNTPIDINNSANERRTKTVDKKNDFAVASDKVVIVKKTEVEKPSVAPTIQSQSQTTLITNPTPSNTPIITPKIITSPEPSIKPPQVSVNEILKRDKEQAAKIKQSLPAVIVKNGVTSPNIYNFIPKVKPPLEHTVIPPQQQRGPNQSVTAIQQQAPPQIKTLKISGGAKNNTTMEQQQQHQQQSNPQKTLDPLNFIPIKREISQDSNRYSPQKIIQQRQVTASPQYKKVIIGAENNVVPPIQSHSPSPTTTQTTPPPSPRKTPVNMAGLSQLKQKSQLQSATQEIPTNIPISPESDSLKILQEKRAAILKQQREEIDKIKFKKEQMVKLNNRKKEIALMKSIQLEQAKLHMLKQKQAAINTLIQNGGVQNTPQQPSVITTRKNTAATIVQKTNDTVNPSINNNSLAQTTVPHLKRTQKASSTNIQNANVKSSYDKINALNSTESFKMKEVIADKKPVVIDAVIIPKTGNKNDNAKKLDVKKTDGINEIEIKDSSESKIKKDNSELSTHTKGPSDAKAIVSKETKDTKDTKHSESDTNETKSEKNATLDASSTSKKQQSTKSNNDLQYYSKDERPDVKWGSRTELYDFNKFTNQTCFNNNICKFFANSKQESQYLKRDLSQDEKANLLKTTYGFKHLDKLKIVTSQKTGTGTSTDIVDYLYRVLFFENIKLIDDGK